MSAVFAKIVPSQLNVIRGDDGRLYLINSFNDPRDKDGLMYYCELKHVLKEFPKYGDYVCIVEPKDEVKTRGHIGFLGKELALIKRLDLTEVASWQTILEAGARLDGYELAEIAEWLLKKKAPHVLEFFKDRGLLLNSFGKPLPLMRVAAARGYFTVVEWLIEAGDQYHMLYYDVLLSAIERTDVDMVRLLIVKGAPVMQCLKALQQAAKEAGFAMMEWFVSPDVDRVAFNEDDLVEWAMLEDLQLFNYLLINSGTFGDEALLAVIRDRRLPVVKCLSQSGAASCGRRLLHKAFEFAIQEGALEIMDYLYSELAPVEEVSVPVLMGVMKKHVNRLEVLKRLVEYGVSLDEVKDDMLVVAVKEIGGLEMTRCLLEICADPDTQNGEPVMSAVQAGNYDKLELLLKYGADAAIRDSAAVRQALVDKRLDIAVLLVLNGADLDARFGEADEIGRPNHMKALRLILSKAVL